MARQFLAAIRHLVRSADPAIPTPGAGDEYLNSTSNVKRYYNGSSWEYSNEFAGTFNIQGPLAVGITGRKQRLYNRSGSTWYLIAANLYVDTAPVGSNATLIVNKNGSAVITTLVLSGTNVGTANPTVTVSDGDYLDVDVTTVGSTVAGADATLTLSFAS
jgi:hypothetical protein